MHASLRLVLCVVYLYSAVTVLCRFCPGWSEALTVEIDRAGQERERQEQRRAEDALEKAKEEVAAALVAGRLTLWEAGARFAALDEQFPCVRGEGASRRFPGRSEEERRCREVIAYAEELLADQPDQAEELVARLQLELEEHFGPPQRKRFAGPARYRRTPWGRLSTG
ncbi:MAG TPA: hypothetical protein VNK04_00910 [Gemmataceae bacterium]|nr:hypothetical protein [Gemmataceae bacterium]